MRLSPPAIRKSTEAYSRALKTWMRTMSISRCPSIAHAVRQHLHLRVHEIAVERQRQQHPVRAGLEPARQVHHQAPVLHVARGAGGGHLVVRPQHAEMHGERLAELLAGRLRAERLAHELITAPEILEGFHRRLDLRPPTPPPPPDD